jgi:hypothetical protein
MAAPIPSAFTPVDSAYATINTHMSSVHTEGSEWTFGILTNTWQHTNFARWQRTFLTLPARQFRVASLLTNLRTVTPSPCGSGATGSAPISLICTLMSMAVGKE